MLFHEQINELDGFIKRHREYNVLESRDPSSKDANLTWKASNLLAELLYTAKGYYYTTDPQSVEHLCNDFYSRNNVSIDVDELLSKFWLRKVLGRIRIAGKLNSELTEFKNVQPFLTELRFLLETEKKYKLPELDTVTGLTREIVESEISAYEDIHGLHLNPEGIYYRRWFDPNENRFTSLDIYFKHFSDAANEYSFLLALSGIIVSAAHLFISEQDAKSIHQNHLAQYPGTPSIDKLVESQSLIPVEGGYHLHVTGGYWSDLKDEISGLLWENLLLKGSHTDSAALIWWVEKINHFCQLVDLIGYVTSQAATRFLDAAVKCLLEEPDLDDADKERKKLMLENSSGHPYAENFLERAPHLNGSDAYLMYQDLDALDDHFQHNFLYDQPSRYGLPALVQIIVLHDNKYSNPGDPNQVHFKRVVSLFEEGVSKPYLLFETTEAVINFKPQILAYLLTDVKYASLALLLLDKIKTDKEEHTADELWKRSVLLLLAMLQEKNIQGQKAALIIFRLFVLLNRKQGSRSISPMYSSLAGKKDLILDILEDQPLRGTYNGYATRQFLFPTVFNELAQLFMAFPETDRWETSSVYFPIDKWCGLSWLLKLYFDIRYTVQMDDKEAAANSIAQVLVDSYKQLMEIVKKKTFDYAQFKDVESVINWSEDGSGIPMIGWLYLAVLLFKKDKLKEFVVLDIHFRVADDQYDVYNKMTAAKVRTHIMVLLELLKQSQEPAAQVLFEKAALDGIAEEAENAILVLLQHHTHDPIQAKYDVLEEVRGLKKDEPLLSRLAKSMYGFKKQAEFIHTIIESGDMAKLLTLLDHVTSESLRLVIIKQIKEQNIDQILASYHWIPDVQHVFVRVVKYPELVDQTEKAIQYWSNQISKRSSGDYKETLYNVRLFHAYLMKDKKALQEIQPLEGAFQNNNSKLNAKDYKDFYMGLLLLGNDPDTAYHLFNNVYSSKPMFITFGINRTVARLNRIKQQNKNISAELQAAYQEWSIFRSKLTKEAAEEMEPEMTSIEMSLLLRLKDYNQSDRKFEELPAYQKFTPDILQIQVQSLQARDRINEALYLITKADEFHFYPGAPQPAFLAILKDRLIGIDNVQELQISLLRIMEVEPDNLVKILPTAFNGKKDVVSFLVKEVTIACSKMLDKIKAIDKIGLEDKYNDLVEVLLNARITFWNWRVSGQSRAAFSATGKDAGERDLPVTDKNDQTLLITEAFIYRDQARTEEHLQKVFNYNHRRNAFCILVYDTGCTASNFDDRWKEYIDTVLPAVRFPEGFAKKGDAVEISREFHTDLSAIRVAKTIHGEGTTVYHVFVNIKYELKTKP